MFGPSQHSTISQRYTAASKTLAPQPIDLQKSAKLTTKDAEYAAVADQLTLPKSLPAVVKQKALAVTKGLTTQYEKAVAIENFFLDTNRFKYSVNGPPGSGFAALAAFLTTHPSGYCQQFADTMALMARAVGIPSRVAIGFTTGDERRQQRPLRRHQPRRPRLARAVLQGHRLAAVRADPAR